MDRSAEATDTDADQETFETTRQELRTTFEYQVQRLREIDSKAIELLKANLLLIGIVVTAGSILIQTELGTDPFLNAFTLTGVGLLLLSTWLAGVTYTSSNLRGGLGADAVEDAVNARDGVIDTKEFEDRVLESYSQWIEYNARVTAVNDMLVTVTVLLVVVAFVYVSVGLSIGVIDPGLLVSVAVFVLLSAGILWISVLIYRMDHLDTAQPRFEDTYEGVMLSKGATRDDGLVALKEMLSGTESDDE